MALNKDEIEHRFGFHKATLEGRNATALKHSVLRARYKEFASVLNNALPDGREKSLALTALEEASMWSHKAIASQAPLGED